MVPQRGILDCKNTNQFQRFAVFWKDYLLMVVNLGIGEFFIFFSVMVDSYVVTPT